MCKKLNLMAFLMLMVVLTGMVQAATIREDFEGQNPPSTDAPPARWIFIDAEDQAGTFYEVIRGGDNTVGRVKADVVVNGFYAAGYIVYDSPVPAASAFSGSFDMLVEDEGGWSDGLFLFGDILNGHTDNYFTFKYVNASSDMYQSDYPADSRILVAATGFGIEFNVWYTTTFNWEPIDGTLGVMTLEAFDQQDLSLVLVSAEITLPEAVYFGLGSSNDAVRLDNIAIEYVDPAEASNPWPDDGHPDAAARGLTLSWTPGIFARTHDIYLGTAFDDVDDATTTVDPASVYIGGQSEATYALDRLDLGQTYYWRIDEVNAPPDLTVFKGDVWSFTVEPVGYPIAGENITATASSSNSADEGPENTINGSGLDADDLHSILGTDMWFSASEPRGAWIQYEFDKVYKLHEIWVWNSNREGLNTIYGLKDVTIEYSVDGDTYTPLGTYEFAQAPGVAGYAHNTIVDSGNVVAKYVRISASSNWSGGIVDQYGLAEVRFFYIPTHAREPNPDSGATDVSIGTIDEPIDVTLGFRAGREAAMHDVYLSTDEQAVIDGTAPVTTEIETSHGPLSLDVGQTYYWRVDEANEAETPATWQGDIWNFTTQEYFVIDDFEAYNDLNPDDPNSNRIFLTWIGGDVDPANGSQVGNDTLPFAELTVVHGGKQSMPYFYDNSVGYSEATVMLSSQRRDWTKRGIGSLSLWFRGYPASVGSFVEAPAGTYTMTAAGANIWYASDEFHFAYKTLNGPGSIIAKVESIEQTHAWAKGGVMVRDTLEPDSAHGTMFLMAAAAQGVTFERRLAVGENTARNQQTGIAAPYWVKIEVEASRAVRASYSADGNAWTELGRDVITMNGPVHIGLALTSHEVDLTCEAVFSNVQIDGAVSGGWMNQDIGILSNDPEPMYVALANSGGTPEVVPHPDPNVTQMGTWTEWNIDLRQFADKGVDLTKVDKLSIGFGDRDNPQPGSSGKMYFDDIRLHPLREPEADIAGN
jgi:hypothetical protein